MCAWFRLLPRGESTSPGIPRGGSPGRCGYPPRPRVRRRASVRRRELVRLPRRWLWLGLACGCVGHLAILIGLGVSWDDYGRTDLLATRSGYNAIMGWVHAVVFGPAIAVLLRQGVLFLRIGRDVRPVDLLDHAALAPFVHASLRLTLLHTLWIACITAFHVDWGGSLDVAPQVIWALPLYLLISGILFALPLWGVHQQLRAERSAELSRVNAAIRGNRHALRDSLVAADAAGDRAYSATRLCWSIGIGGGAMTP